MRLCGHWIHHRPGDPASPCASGPLRLGNQPDPLRCARCGGWTPHGGLPSHERVAILAREVASLAAQFAEDYAWAHSVAFDPTRRPTAGNGRGGHSDPTGSAVTDKRRLMIRAYTAIAARLLEAAVRAMRSADDAIGSALLAAEPPGPKDHTPAPYHDTIPQNRPDLVEAHAARARRFTRGEGIAT